jgi:hypothetical protein
MPRPKKQKPPPAPKKNLLVERLVEKPSHGIREWLIKEYVFLRRLEEKWPLEFLAAISFGKKLPSLAVLFSEWGQKELQIKYHAYTYQPQEQSQITLFRDKVGEDVIVEKRKSLREIL